MKSLSYTLGVHPNESINKFLDNRFSFNSICHKNYEIKISYLRDLGLPSRSLHDYIKKNYQSNMADDVINTSLNIMGDMMSNFLKESKDETNLLHLLRPNELTINKSRINFFDVMNICTGRITQTNSSLCIRHEKITRAELEKVLKRLERYHKMQREDGKLMMDA